MLKTSILALLLLFCGSALSQEPSQQKPEAITTEKAVANEQPAAAVPPITVNVLPVPKTEAEKVGERHERQEKAELDKKLVELTAELSRYTGGLYIATVVLAIATIFLVVATFGLVVFAFRQARDMKASFVSTHRPRVIVHFIQGPVVGDDKKWLAYVNVVNTGATAATINAFGGDVAFRNRYGWLPPGLKASPVDIKPFRLASGERHMFRVTSQEAMTEKHLFQAVSGERDTWVVGVIRYADDIGVIRETGFSRSYDDRSETFTVSTDPEDEYQY